MFLNKLFLETPKHNFSTAEEAVAPKHDLVEVEITGVSLGSKYYENTKKPQLIEADSKDAQTTKNAEASAEIVNKSDRKVEEVKKTEKKEEKKLEKGKK